METKGCSANDYDHDVEEDVRPYLDNKHPQRAPIPGWCLVTASDKALGDPKMYFLLFDTYKEAAERGGRYILDDIQAERPVEIINLDSNARWVANTATVSYERTQ